MTTALLLGFSCIFLILGHSTLLHFKLEEKEIPTMKEIFFPWPIKGRFVSIICFFLSIGSLVLITRIGVDFSSHDGRHWKILIALFLTPLTLYGYYFISLIKTTQKGNPKEKNQKLQAWKISLIIPAAITLYYFIFK